MFTEKKRQWIIVAVVFAIGIIGGSVGCGVAIATGGGEKDGDEDQPITGSALAECTEAALAENPGGTVTETEVGDDGAAYGVEVRLGDGSEVEVNLDENCQVIGQEADDDGPNDKDGPDDQNDRSK